MDKPPRIVEYKHSTTSPWCITGLKKNGKRTRLFFPTRKAAELELERIQTKLRREGDRALELPDSIRIMALDCSKKLEPFAKTIADACDHYLAFLKAASRSIALGALIEEYLRSQQRAGRSEAHLIDLNYRLGRFVKDFGPEAPVRAIVALQLEDWLHGLDLGAQTVNGFRNKIFGLFKYAQKRGYVEANPVGAIDLIKVVDRPIEIYQPDELQKLLNAASPELRICLAVAAFAGCRTAELLRLTWSDINLVRGYIRIDARNSKTAQRRLIDISENLAEWLKPCLSNGDEPLWKKSVTQFHVAVRELHIAAGVKRKDNALRHCFGSYHLALYQDASKTAHQIGHQSPAVLYQHYRELVSRQAAQHYWNIRPQRPPANLVAFERGEAACA